MADDRFCVRSLLSPSDAPRRMRCDGAPSPPQPADEETRALIRAHPLYAVLEVGRERCTSAATIALAAARDKMRSRDNQ